MLSYYAQETVREQPAGFFCPVCPGDVRGALPSQQLGDGRMFMKAVETEHMFSFWGASCARY